ncbi:MAG: fused protease/ribonucleoside-triphosphate reductase, partial [Promethearchaeota archaeon]
LDESFISQYIGKQPEWGPLGYITYKRTYARLIEKENRKEEFRETIRRVVEGCYSIQKEHCLKLSLPWDSSKAQKSAQKMFEKIWNFRMTPPGRGLWMMGTEFIARHGSMALNNCGFASTEDIDLKYSKAFEFMMDALMLGVGVGFDTKGAGKITIKEPQEGQFVFQLPDSREGWVDALRLILEAYFLGKQAPTYDFSLIRPAGTPIRGFGGIASGHKPLEEMLNDIQSILKARIGQKITSVDILDIMNHIGKCVVAGNVRRSAEIALGDPADVEIVTSKQDKDKLYSHRWASNNSVFAMKGLDYSFIAEQIKINGEPGVFWLENAKNYSRMGSKPDFKDKKAAGVNPCGEQTLESFELCCLVETFPSRHESYEEFQETLKFAYLYSKSVTLVNTHWKETNAVMLKNRRMGISQTGIIEAFVKHGRRQILDWCDKGYKYLRELDEIYSDWLCVPKSIKITTVKPSGTVSLLPGVPPGIHYPHSEYYIRRIRISKNSDLIEPIRAAGYPIEDDSYSPNTIVAEFPVHEKYFSRSKNMVSIWEQAENAAAYQKYWSDNQVSITITFQQEEAKEIKHVLEAYEDKLKSASFLPIKEHGYKQAPYEEITKEKYEEMVSKITPILSLDKTQDRAIGELFCDSDKCEVRFDL